MAVEPLDADTNEEYLERIESKVEKILEELKRLRSELDDFRRESGKERD
jgi:hypothetical protein